MKEAELGKFGFLLGTLLGAGLSVIQCFESLSKSTSTLRYKKLYVHLLLNLSDGFSFKQSFNTYPKIDLLIP